MGLKVLSESHKSTTSTDFQIRSLVATPHILKSIKNSESSVPKFYELIENLTTSSAPSSSRNLKSSSINYLISI